MTIFSLVSKLHMIMKTTMTKKKKMMMMMMDIVMKGSWRRRERGLTQNDDVAEGEIFSKRRALGDFFKACTPRAC